MAAGDPLQSLLHGDPLKPTDVDLAALTRKIGHTFGRPELAAEALTHRGALDRRSDLKAAFPSWTPDSSSSNPTWRKRDSFYRARKRD